MKSKITFISRLFIVVAASSLPVFAVYGQNTGDATTGADAHPTTDSPYLRRAKATPGASAAAATKLSQKDQKFLSQIAAGGVQAVEDSKVAEGEGGAGVKAIASRIVNERGRSNQELLDLAKKKGLGLGTGKIKARSMGKGNFDKQFAHTLSRDLDEDVKLLQGAAQSSDDKEVKAWAAKTLPMVKQHANALKQAGGKG
jgi:putative membrane protein